MRLFLALALICGAAFADDARQQAKVLKDLGAAAMQRKEFRSALDHFQRAYQTFPSPRLKFNIAMALEQLARDAEALPLYDEFIAESPDAPPTQLAYAIDRVNELNRKLGMLRLSCNVPADVLIDGIKVGATPLNQALRVTPGEREIAVAAPGFQTFRTIQRFATHEQRSIEVLLEEEAQPPPVVERPAPSRPPELKPPVVTPKTPLVARTPTYKKWWVWTPVAVAGVGLAVGLGLGLGLNHRFWCNQDPQQISGTGGNGCSQ
jgi:hypothetical protein